MGSYATRVRWEPLRSIDSATFTGSYQALGTPLAHECYLVKFVSGSNVAATISTDATLVAGEDYIPAGGGFIYDEQSNSSRVGGQRVPKGTQFYIKGSAGIGSIYLVAKYAGEV